GIGCGERYRSADGTRRSKQKARMTMKRGFPALLALVIGLAAANPCEAKGETTPIVAPLVKISTDPFLELETYRLWPGRARDASSDAEDETPTMTVFRPQRGQANGTAIVVAPGGGYIGLAANLEGRQVADWFAAHGVTAFLLKYRVGPKARL